jgi:hypothetical protein
MIGHRSSAWLVVMLAVLLAGCGGLPGQDIGLTDGVGVDNRTSQPLVFKVFSHGDWWTAGRAEAHDTTLAIGARDMGPNGLIGTNGCTDGDLVAYTLAGVEVARHAPPLCVDDRWVIKEPTASPTASPSPS